MKQRHRVITLVCLLIVVAIATTTVIVVNKKIHTRDIENEAAFVPVPFGGYVCGYENTETFLQIPLLFNGAAELSVNDISRVVLKSDNIELSCQGYALSYYKHNEENNYMLSTLSFKVMLPTKGKYTVDQLQLTMHNGKTLNKKLGKIIFHVTNAEDSDAAISMTQFMINQQDYKLYKIAYRNNTDETISLIGLDYPENMFVGQTIKMYSDFDTTTPETGLDIPPGEERTFLFSFESKSGYFSGNHSFLFMLPFINYSIDGLTKTIPAQTQATIIQSPLTSDYVKQLFEANGIR
jgi:hypothetical protein